MTPLVGSELPPEAYAFVVDASQGRYFASLVELDAFEAFLETSSERTSAFGVDVSSAFSAREGRKHSSFVSASFDLAPQDRYGNQDTKYGIPLVRVRSPLASLVRTQITGSLYIPFLIYSKHTYLKFW